MLTYWTSTPVYNSAAFRYPETANDGAMIIPITITAYKSPSAATKSKAIHGIPTLSPSQNNAWAQQIATFGASETVKLQLSGFMDTPCTPSGSYYIPAIFKGGPSGAHRVTYADVIALNMEGRANSSLENIDAVHPDWFRDGWGRVFTSPRVVSFTAAPVEGAPFRQTFELTLHLTIGTDL